MMPPMKLTGMRTESRDSVAATTALKISLAPFRTASFWLKPMTR